MVTSANKRAPTRPVGRASDAKSRRPTVKRALLGPIGRLEDFIPYKLSVVANRVSQSIGRIFETKYNIQVPEWRIMMALYAFEDLAFNEVVEQTSMDKARVSRAHRRLLDLQLITSVNDPTDKRKIILALTDKGEKMCVEILPDAAKREAWYLAVLDEEEQRQFDRILDKLMKRSVET